MRQATIALYSPKLQMAPIIPEMNKSDKLVDGKTFESKTAKSKTTENRKSTNPNLTPK